MEMFLIEPSKIKIAEGAPRYREDVGDIKSLAESFRKTRQILPIVITRNMELIDGGRRLAACIFNKQKVKCVYEDVVDLAEMRELEIEANLHRKNFTPAEEAIAVRDLHELKQKRHGMPMGNPGGSLEGQSIRDTAAMIGKSAAHVAEAIQLAKLIDDFPQLRNAKKKTDIKKAAKGLLKLTSALKGLKAHSDALEQNRDLYSLLNTDAVEHMKSLPDSSIDILLTDPLYGIDADQVCMTALSRTGGEITTSGYKISDTKQDAFYYYRVLAKESFRFCTPSAQGYVFCGPEHYHIVSKFFRKAGWNVYVKPMLWIKRESGQCNVPSMWPASCYEMFIFIRKDQSRLIQEGMPDWIECPPVDSSKKLHPYEKPVPLLVNLLRRICTPGQKLYDPFAGSASTIEAAVQCKLFALGCELSKEAFSMALARLAQMDK